MMSEQCAYGDLRKFLDYCLRFDTPKDGYLPSADIITILKEIQFDNIAQHIENIGFRYNQHNTSVVYLDYQSLVSCVLAKQLAHLTEILWFAWMENRNTDQVNGLIDFECLETLLEDSKLLRLFLLSLDPEPLDLNSTIFKFLCLIFNFFC